jgi:hypothetical protein
MCASRKLIGIASTVLFVSLAQAGLAAEPKARAAGQMLAMDDMKPMQPGPMGQSGNSMVPAAGQSQPMGQKSMMMDDKMKAPPSAPMQDQGKMGQPGAQGGMMTMMEKMMQGHMGGMSGMGAATGTTGMATGTADVTERIEGRIAFLKAELQITDKQMAEWNVLAEALRSGRQHLVEARKFLVMDDKTSSADRLARYEGHLTERLEAIKSARAAFVRLYPNLDDAQKQTADAILLPLIATF